MHDAAAMAAAIASGHVPHTGDVLSSVAGGVWKTAPVVAITTGGSASRLSFTNGSRWPTTPMRGSVVSHSVTTSHSDPDIAKAPTSGAATAG